MPTPMASKTTALSNSRTKRISKIKSLAALSRWESVKQERAIWLKPFEELPLERALAYLEDLRKITEDAGRIINQRIGEDKGRMKCCNCKKDLSGTNPSGRPMYMGKFDMRSKNNPEIIVSVYVCSMACQNAFARKHGGAFGGTQ